MACDLTGDRATYAANCRASAFTALLRQPSAIASDIGSGKISSSSFSTPSKIALAADCGEAFGISRFRVISVSRGPGKAVWTLTPRPASSARSDCESENAAAFEATNAIRNGRLGHVQLACQIGEREGRDGAVIDLRSGMFP